LYSVDAYSIKESRPRFNCNQCQKVFWISYPECLGNEEIIGFPEEWLPTPQKSAQAIKTDSKKQTKVANGPKCTNCQTVNSPGAKECVSCGIILKKAEKKESDPLWFYASKEAKELWVKILDDYENHELHQEFLRQCRKSNQLEFATSRYSRILSTTPQDDIAKKYSLEILALAGMAFSRAQDVGAQKKKVRLPFAFLIYFLCGAVIAAGYFLPGFRNLVGIGTSALFLTVAIKLYFR